MARKRKKNSGIRARHLVVGVLLTAALALLLTPGTPAGATPGGLDDGEACVSGLHVMAPELKAPQVPERRSPRHQRQKSLRRPRKRRRRPSRRAA